MVTHARVALLGYGRIGALHARTIRERVPSLQIAYVSDPVESARDNAVTLGYTVVAEWQDVIARQDIDAVLIASATALHPPQIVAAAHAGKAIFCEKPIGTNLRETDAALEAVRRAGCPLQVGFQRRFDPPLVAVHQAVHRGDVGRPLLLRVSARDPAPPPAWYPRFPGGLYVDSAIHDLDAARYLLGDVDQITSVGAALFDELAEVAGDVDTAGTLLRFASGALGVLDNCRVSAPGFDQRIEVHGTEGSAATENINQLGATVSTATGIVRPANVDFFTQRYAEAYVAEFTAFAGVIDGADPLATGDDARKAFVLALAAERSRTTQLPVNVAAFSAELSAGAPGASVSQAAR